MICKSCDMKNDTTWYFCRKCGTFLLAEDFEDKKCLLEPEEKVKRIIENLKHNPHYKIVWDDTVDLYTKKVEKFKSILQIKDLGVDEDFPLYDKINEFLDVCYKPEFQIAFVGTIKTGKSTLINSFLGRNYASMAVTPETAALTKFRSSEKDYISVTFYDKNEWKELWTSRTSAADAFMKEYDALNADAQRDRWIGHKPITKSLANSEIEDELSIWSSSKRAEHYFVKEIEVGISTLPENFPKQIVFVDTPGLSDPVAYRSEITKKYIKKANAVFVCVDAQKVQKSEIETISSVFSFSSHNKNKVHIIATHWDKLNDPEADWKEQKEWLEKQLVGKGFFDTHEMAKSNILHSAAHVFNLCRDYSQLSSKETKPLRQLAIAFDIDPIEIRDSLNELMELSNIEEIGNIISEKLVKNYVSLLYKDIEKNYFDIIFDLKRYASQTSDDLNKVIDASNEKIEKLRIIETKEKKSYDEVLKCKKQLEAALKTVDMNTKKRLEIILPKLEKMAK